MTKNSNVNIDSINFEEKYAGLTDLELTNILKKRNHYRDEAVKAAIKEGIKRGIIHSEQDLFGEKFKVEPLRFTLFPAIVNTAIREKTLKSMSRSLIIVGAIPTLFGGYNVYKNFSAENLAMAVLGIIWVVLAFTLMKKPNRKIIAVLFVLWAGAGAFVIFKLAGLAYVSGYDMLFSAAALMLVLYGLVYIRKLVE